MMIKLLLKVNLSLQSEFSIYSVSFFEMYCLFQASRQQRGREREGTGPEETGQQQGEPGGGAGGEGAQRREEERKTRLGLR